MKKEEVSAIYMLTHSENPETLKKIGTWNEERGSKCNLHADSFWYKAQFIGRLIEKILVCMFVVLICWQKIPGANPEKIRNLKAEDDDAGPNGLVEYRVVPGDGSDRQTKPNRAP
jgi:hypothetical protein